jgi:hypothetical protein
MVDEIVASALALSRAGPWTQAPRLLDVSPANAGGSVAAASVAPESDWFADTSLAAERLAAVVEPG